MLLTAGFGGCIDDSYDLSDAKGGITVGSGEEIVMPLMTVTIRVSDLLGSSGDIHAMLDEADIWLPTTLPGGVTYVDLSKVLGGDLAYIQSLLDGLLEEMQQSTPKLEAVAGLIASKSQYRDAFSAVIATSDPDAFRQQFVSSFQNSATAEVLKMATAEEARKYLTGMNIEPADFEIDPIDIGDDVLDMLGDNLDGDTAYIELYGSILSQLPLSLRSRPAFLTTPAIEAVEEMLLEPNAQNDQLKLRVSSRQELENIFRGTTIRFPIGLEKYYRTGLSDDQQIRIGLKLRKTGGLTL